MMFLRMINNLRPLLGTLLIVVTFGLVACSGLQRIEKVPEGGTASVKTDGEKTTVVIKQPENSDTTTTFEMKIIKAEKTKITNTNTVFENDWLGDYSNLTFSASLGKAKDGYSQIQKAYGDVKTLSTKLDSMKILYWFGGGFMALGILMFAFKSKLPFIGFKVVAGTILLGVCLCLVPFAMTDTIFRYVIFAIGAGYMFILGKKFTT